MFVDHHFVDAHDVYVLFLSDDHDVSWMTLDCPELYTLSDKDIFLRDHHTSAVVRVPEPKLVVIVQSNQEIGTCTLGHFRKV